MLSFYVDLLVRAFFAIPTSLGSNMLGLLWPVIIVFCGEFIAYIIYGWRVMIAKWKQASLIGLAALGICYTVLFGWCILATNYQEHSKLSSRVSVLQQANDTNSERQKYAVLQAQSTCAEMVGENRALGQQNRDQQNTINNCQTQALRLVADTQSLKLTDYYLGDVPKQYNNNVRGKYHGTFIVMTNKPISPIRLLVSCEADLIEVSGGVLGTNAALGGGWGGRVTGSQKQYGFGLLSPAWTPVNPLLLTVYTDAAEIGRCTFDEK